GRRDQFRRLDRHRGAVRHDGSPASLGRHDRAARLCGPPPRWRRRDRAHSLTRVPPMPSWLTQIIQGVLPFLLAWLSSKGWALLEKGVTAFENISPTWKPLAVAVVAWIVVHLAALLQTALPGDITTWTPDTVNTLLTAVVAAIMHMATSKQSAAAPPPAAPVANIAAAAKK